jgi:hypothetical protein
VNRGNSVKKKSVEKEGFCQQGEGRQYFVGLIVEEDVL